MTKRLNYLSAGQAQALFTESHRAYYKKEFQRNWDEEKDPEICDWKRVRSAIEHENFLSLERSKMLTSTQAFLFAAYSVLYIGVKPEDIQQSGWLLSTVAAAGAISSVFVIFGMRAARIQHDELEDWWESRTRKVDRGRHPPISGEDPNGIVGRYVLRYHYFPLVFLIAWTSFFAFPFFRGGNDLYGEISSIFMSSRGTIFDCRYRYTGDGKLVLRSFKCHERQELDSNRTNLSIN